MARNASVSLLAFAVGVAPLGTSALAAGEVAPGPTGQATALGNAAKTNNAASGLAQLSSLLSMAAGGLYMAKGVEQLKCCSGGCTGNGTAAKNTQEQLNEQTKRKAASTITGTPPPKRAMDFWKLRFPDEASNCPSTVRPGGPGFLMLYDLLSPPKAQAATGCIDAMLALVTGGLMMLQGIMGMQAANKSAQMADSTLGNMNNMGGLNTAGTSPTPERNTSSLGGSGASREPIKMDPALLRKGTANDIMNQFENKFGIGRDQFAKSVMGGADPRALLNSAPKNALSNDDMNKATNAAKGMSDADKANAMAGTQLSDAQKELAAKLGTGAGNDAFAVNAAGGSGSSSLKGFSTKAKDGELESLETTPVAEAGMEVSPDVQAALAAKELDDRKNGITDLSIFQVVHNKYREKAKMIFGFDPDGSPRGVANTNGM